MDTMTLAAQRLVDWRTAEVVGTRVAGTGPPLTPLERARIAEDFAEVVPEAERMVASFTDSIVNWVKSVSPQSSKLSMYFMTTDFWYAPARRRAMAAAPQGQAGAVCHLQ